MLIKHGTIDGALKGAFSGAMFGAIGGAYGNSWDFSRVALNGVAGGVSAQVNGGNFIKGMGISLALAGLSYTNLMMNRFEQGYCGASPTMCTKPGEGFFGGPALAGTRPVLNADWESGLAGGLQGGVGRLAGMRYGPNGAMHTLSEAFAGPHDFLNDMVGMYDRTTGYALPWSATVYGDGLSYTNVVIAIPFAGAPLIPNSAYQYMTQ